MVNHKMTIAHLQNALDNVQSNIRHIDTKVAGAMGLVVVVLGFCVSRPVLASQLRFSVPVSLWFRVPELILVAIAVVLLVAAVCYASATLFPRIGIDPRLKNKVWLLFPLAKTDAEAVVLRDTLETKVVNGMRIEDVIAEYLDQLAILGHIQTLKMDACKSLFKYVWAFCATMLLLGTISLICHMDIPFKNSVVSAPLNLLRVGEWAVVGVNVRIDVVYETCDFGEKVWGDRLYYGPLSHRRTDFRIEKFCRSWGKT